MFEILCIAAAICFVLWIAGLEDKWQAAADARQLQAELNTLEPATRWDPIYRCEVPTWQLEREAEDEEEEARIEKKRASRLKRLEREHRLVGDWLAVAGYDTPQEDALMSTLIEVEGAIADIEHGYA